MRIRYPLSLAIALIIAGSYPARADDPPARDVASIGDCLRKQEKRKGGSTQEADEAACLMTIARPCMGGDEAARGRPPQNGLPGARAPGLGQSAQRCSYKRNKTMMKALDADQRTKLREMQHTWMQTRDLTCAFWYDYFRGTMANPMIAYCNNPRDRAARNLLAGVCRRHRGSKINLGAATARAGSTHRGSISISPQPHPLVCGPTSR